MSFAERFIDVLGTGQPAKIERLLNIPYQTIRNYLKGRLPSAEILILISQKTSCSIDYLLTGRGKKFLYDGELQDTPLPTDQMETFVRRICVEVINEREQDQQTPVQKVVVLQPSDILSEKVEEETPTRTGG